MRTYEETEKLSSSDTEITLGMRSILGIFFGLALICGVFFGFGYSLGRDNTGPKAALAQTPSHGSAVVHPAAVKTVVEEPEASGDDQYGDAGDGDQPVQKPTTPPLQRKPSAAAVAVSEAPAGAGSGQQNPVPAAQAQAQVARTAYSLPAPATVAATPDTASAAPPAAIMVQIAAVSRREDADVLVSALNKLGYSASVRSANTDNLLHVQVGPFATRDQAKAMRTKLLNDGYNAILK